jgi:transcriptional regulator with XRE-family HTH domain
VSESPLPDESANPFRVARVRKVASALGVRPATVVAWEQGAQPRQATLERVAAFYGVSADDLRSAGPEAQTLPGKVVIAPGEPVVIDPITFGRMYERLEMTVEMVDLLDSQAGAMTKTVHSVGESLEALRATLRRLGGGVALVLERDLPTPPRLTKAQELAADIEAATARGKGAKRNDADDDRRAAGGAG